MRAAIRWGLVLGALLTAAPASAQVIHSVQFGMGVVMPRGADGRVNGDVLIANLNQPRIEVDGELLDPSFVFDVNDFRTAQIFGEWNVAFGDRIEIGAGLGYHRRTVHSVIRDFVDSSRGFADIEQQLRLRVVPVTGVVRFMPFGRAGDFQPYVGLGVGILNWRYSELGDFMDPNDFTVFTPTGDDRFIVTGTSAGPILLGGIRVPMGGDLYAFTMEGRYQWATGDTGGAPKFLGDKIDLGGGQVNFGFLVRF